MSEQTMRLYESLGVLHQPATSGDTHTACGLDTAGMREKDHPVMHAGRWCTACLRAIFADALIYEDDEAKP